MMGPPPRRPPLSAQDLTPQELGRLGPLGARALSYVRDHWPTAFATIPDPVSFFVALAEEIGEQVLATEQALRPAPAPGEDWGQAVGEMRMVHLAAESQVFQEMVFERWPAEDESEDLTPDPADPAHNRYLAQLDDLRSMQRDIRAAMEQADREDT